MKISYLLTSAALILFLGSCNSSQGPDVDTSLMNTVNTPAPVLTSDSNTDAPAFVLDTSNINPENIKEAPAEVYRAAGLNPAHGQPGHDCAIAVGAPLNGIPAANSNPAPVSSPIVNFPTSPLPAPAAGTGRLNPAHGQPGHDCAIPVGAPLS